MKTQGQELSEAHPLVSLGLTLGQRETLSHGRDGVAEDDICVCPLAYALQNQVFYTGHVF